MTNNRTLAKFLTLIAVMSCTSPGLLAQEGTPAAAPLCAACHGELGASKNPLVPTLAGQPYTLIEDNLLAFRAGKRACAEELNDGSPSALLAETMCGQVKELSDAEIAALAAYFENQAFEPAQQGFESGLAEQGSRLHVDKGCEQCHSDGGRTTNDMAPVLAGQWTPYLRRALESLRAGLRSGPKMMSSAIHELEDREVEALLNYYASQTHF